MSALTSLRFSSPLLNVIRQASTLPQSLPQTNTEIQPIITNRNPRNLERLRLARKPLGYGLDNKVVTFWHKLVIIQSSKSVTATLVHNTDKEVIRASTTEWSIRKFLYSPTDKMAYKVLAQVFAERCLESGITNCICDINPEEGTKPDLFIKTIKQEGLCLEEPNVFNIYNIWRTQPEKKPWTVLED